jgi:hypothetical protein
VQMDADFSHSPEAIPGLLEALAESDAAFGSVSVAGGRLTSAGAQAVGAIALRELVRAADPEAPAARCHGRICAWRAQTLQAMPLNGSDRMDTSFRSKWRVQQRLDLRRRASDLLRRPALDAPRCRSEFSSGPPCASGRCWSHTEGSVRRLPAEIRRRDERKQPRSQCVHAATSSEWSRQLLGRTVGTSPPGRGLLLGLSAVVGVPLLSPDGLATFAVASIHRTGPRSSSCPVGLRSDTVALRGHAHGHSVAVARSSVRP